MKITTWNVNGIRAAMKKGMKEWVILQSPDIFCMQEIKATQQQLTDEQKDFPAYTAYWNSANRLGYSGVATLVKELPQSVSFGLGDDRFDIEGRVIRTDFPDFILFNIYFPNGQRGQERVQYKLDFYQRLHDICNELHAAGKNIIITGDFNTAHTEIDLRNPNENSNTSGFLPEERVWIDKYLKHGFVDAYRTLYPERIQYTWWTYRLAARKRNIGWRIDYFLVSKNLIPRIKDVIISDEIEGSDHCPVTLEIQ